jgi:hypothetical protein
VVSVSVDPSEIPVGSNGRTLSTNEMEDDWADTALSPLMEASIGRANNIVYQMLVNVVVDSFESGLSMRGSLYIYVEYITHASRADWQVSGELSVLAYRHNPRHRAI